MALTVQVVLRRCDSEERPPVSALRLDLQGGPARGGSSASAATGTGAGPPQTTSDSSESAPARVRVCLPVSLRV